jgi:hypothetical protein
VLREFVGTSDFTVTETVGVISPHGRFIVSAVFIDETDAFDAVLLSEQLLKDLLQVLGDGLVTDDFPFADDTLAIVMLQSQQPQVAASDGGILFKRLPVDTLKDRIADGFNNKPFMGCLCLDP